MVNGRMEDLRSRIESAINRACAESGSNTPDFILATYLLGCLSTFDEAVRERDRWYGAHLEPGSKYFVRTGAASGEPGEAD
jgi:hypothetical protein